MRLFCSVMALSLIPHSALLSQSAPFAVVSAASYQPVVAPDSLATIFGSNLARSTASATLDSNGQLPTELAATRVDVGGAAAGLIYVSPSQINFAMPAGITTGTVDCVIRSTESGASQTAKVQVMNTSAAIFSSDASGKGPGAILNAVTYAGAPFLVETPENGGNDLRTRLALYGTGIRYAGNPSHQPPNTNVAGSVQVQGRDVAGNVYNFTVEYAGAAPGFFGLDQLNIVLPPELDGVGVVTVSISAESVTSNTVSFQMGSLPADAIRLTGITLSQAFVTGGDSVGATLSLNAPARMFGVTVFLASSNPAARTDATVTIPNGKASLPITIGTTAVLTEQTVVITARAGSVTQSATLAIDPANTVQIGSLSITPATILGGRSLAATAVLTGSAPASGVTIQVSSDNPAAQPPSTVSVPFGSNSATFMIPTSAVSAPQQVNITATTSRASKTAQATVAPALQLSLSANTVFSGSPVTGTITLGDPAPSGGAIIGIQSSDPAAQVPSTVTIAAGQTLSTFTITTSTVLTVRTVTITVRSGTNTQSAPLTVNPLGPGTVASVTVSPDHVTGGTSATCTVTLAAPAPATGALVSVRSSSLVATPSPTFTTIPPGQTSANFSIATIPVAAPQTVTISATAGGVTKTAVLTVQ